MENLELFITQIGDADMLNLFISTLLNDDVTTTMFIPANKKQTQEEAIKAKLKPFKLGKSNVASGTSKITTICDALLGTFKKLATTTGDKCDSFKSLPWTVITS